MDDQARRQFDALVMALIKLRKEKREIYATARKLGFDQRSLRAAVSIASVVGIDHNYTATVRGRPQ